MKFYRIVLNEKGQHAWNRWLSVLAALTLSAVFWKQGLTTDIDWGEYIAYSIGMAICYAPVYALKLLRAWKGGGNETPPAATITYPANTGTEGDGL